MVENVAINTGWMNRTKLAVMQNLASNSPALALQRADVLAEYTRTSRDVSGLKKKAKAAELYDRVANDNMEKGQRVRAIENSRKAAELYIETVVKLSEADPLTIYEKQDIPEIIARCSDAIKGRLELAAELSRMGQHETASELYSQAADYYKTTGNLKAPLIYALAIIELAALSDELRKNKQHGKADDVDRKILEITPYATPFTTVLGPDVILK